MIDVDGLTKFYGDFKAVDGVSFSVKRGEIVGLLGPNGAGKTTTLRMMTCYLTPSAGAVSLGGVSVYEDAPAVKRMIGYLPESAPIYGDMVVYDYLRYVAQIQEVSEADVENRIEYVVDKCALKEVIHKKVNELSKGYRQRVGLAHAIIHDPEILILDEPTSGLDPNQIIEIRELIRELGKEKTVILSTHILSEVEASCARVIIINRGKIVADSPTEELIKGAKSKEVVNISVKGASEGELKTLLESVENVEDVSVSSGNFLTSARVTAGEGALVREAIYHAIKETKWIIYEMGAETQSLEAIFQELTKEAH